MISIKLKNIDKYKNDNILESLYKKMVYNNDILEEEILYYKDLVNLFRNEVANFEPHYCIIKNHISVFCKLPLILVEICDIYPAYLILTYIMERDKKTDDLEYGHLYNEKWCLLLSYIFHNLPVNGRIDKNCFFGIPELYFTPKTSIFISDNILKRYNNKIH